MGYQNPRVKGKCVGHRTEGSGLVEVGQTRVMFKVLFLYVCRWPGWDAVVSDKGLDDIVYNTGDTRNFDVKYNNRHIHDVVALGCRIFSVTAASTHARSVRWSEEMPVSSKLTDRTRCWVFIDIADLLQAFRLSDREGESEKLLQKRSRCVTDKWSWLHCFGTYVSVQAPFIRNLFQNWWPICHWLSAAVKIMRVWHGYVMICHFSVRQQHREIETDQKLTAHCIQFVSRGNHRGTHNVSYAWQNRIQ